MILQFRMLSDENDNFVRDFEVPFDMNLFDFHRFILASLEYDDCLASFFTADGKWQPVREYTAVDMGGGDDPSTPMPMEKVLVAQTVMDDSNRLIYQFDLFSGRAYYLELTGAKEASPDFEYPRVAFAHAPAPDQYDPEAVGADERSIFDEMMGDYNEFDGDDDYDDEYRY